MIFELKKLVLGKKELKIISFVYLLDAITKNAHSLNKLNLEDQKIFHEYSSKIYSKIRFLFEKDHSNFAGNQNSQLVHPHDFQEQLGKLITLIQNQPQMKSDDDDIFSSKEMMRISICYFVGYIEAEIYPGTANKM